MPGTKNQPISAKGQYAIKLCEQFPDAPSRSLAKRLHAEYGGTLDSCRSMIRMARGNSGQIKRNGLRASLHVRRKNGRSGEHRVQMPPSLAEPWVPHTLTGKRIGVISDLHIPYHDEQALEAAIGWLKKTGVDTVLMLGDIGDWYGLSRFQKRPSKRDLRKELGAQRQFLEWIRQEFPKAELIAKYGNHEERWDQFCWNAYAELSDEPELRLSTWLRFDSLGITEVNDQRPVLVGKLPALHGHELGRSIFSPVNPARGAFLRTSHTIMVGHSHQTSGHANSNLWHEEIFCWSLGALCDLSPEYSRVNRWNHGFAFVEVAEDKEFEVTNLRISNGVVRKT